MVYQCHRLLSMERAFLGTTNQFRACFMPAGSPYIRCRCCVLTSWLTISVIYMRVYCLNVVNNGRWYTISNHCIFNKPVLNKTDTQLNIYRRYSCYYCCYYNYNYYYYNYDYYCKGTSWNEISQSRARVEDGSLRLVTSVYMPAGMCWK